MPYKNRADQKVAARRHYERNTQKVKDRARAHNLQQYLRLRKYVDIEKSKPCMDCGTSYPPYVMDFDHRGDKIANVGDMMSGALSLKTVKAEISKCDLVCSNCHRERTHQRKLAALTVAPFDLSEKGSEIVADAMLPFE